MTTLHFQCPAPAPQAADAAGRQTVLLVDDDLVVLEIVNECLRPHYQTRVAMRGDLALELACRPPVPDLILLDVELPDMAGYEVCAALKRNRLTADIPVIFLSSHSDVGDITRGLESGGVDYVTKPVAPPILLARLRTHLHLRDQNLHLETLVRARTQELESATTELHRDRDLAMIALGALAETRDNETGNHIRRTCAYVELLARHLATLPAYRNLPASHWERIWKSAPLHDIGKVGIPDHILLKPGKLEVDEFELMKRHTVLGRDALRLAEQRIGAETTFLRTAVEIAYCHHERWDGKGYPEGLHGNSIPLSARLMAIADVYDALTSKRVYKAAISHAEASEIIVSERDRHFDPQLIDCFIAENERFREIATSFCDF